MACGKENYYTQAHDITNYTHKKIRYVYLTVLMMSEQNALQEGKKASRTDVIKAHVLKARQACPSQECTTPAPDIRGDLLLLYNWFEGQRKNLLTKMSPLHSFFS